MKDLGGSISARERDIKAERDAFGKQMKEDLANAIQSAKLAKEPTYNLSELEKEAKGKEQGFDLFGNRERL